MSDKYVDSNLQNRRSMDENQFRKNEQFSDVIIKGKDGTEFKVHKIILASGCPYFKALFDSGMKESNQQIIQLDRDITGEDMEILIEYIYIGEIQLSVEKAKIFSEYALYFQLINLKTYCADILIKSMNLENCLGLWEHGVKFLNDTLIKYFFKYLMDNCQYVIENNYFQLSNEEYSVIATNKNLSKMEKLYLFIYNWIKTDYENRKLFINSLMNYFNFSMLGNIFIMKYIFQDFSNKICEIFENKLGISSVPILIELPQKKYYLISQKIIYITNVSGEAKVLKNDVTSPGFEAITYDNNTLLLCGGNGSTICHYFCPLKNKLETFPSMKYGRHNHSVINLNEYLYVFGGNSNQIVEIFNLRDKQWIDGIKLSHDIDSIGLISWENNIYLFGGFYKYKCRTIVEYLKGNRVYTTIEAAPPLGSTKCVRVDDIVYCFNYEGGYKFNLRTKKWFEKIPQPPVEWSKISSAVLFGNSIAVLGHHESKSVICFLDLIKNIWSAENKFKINCEDLLQIA